jgi:amidase
MLPRTHIVPLAHSQDTPGPMTATVADAALLMSVMAGSDPGDPASAEADGHRQDFAAALSPDALRGKRVGVMRFLAGYHPELDAVFDRALDTLRSAGAEVVEVAEPPGRDDIDTAERIVLLTELRADLNAYLPGAAAPEGRRTLAGLIAFNKARADRELALFQQELFDKAEGTRGLDDTGYLRARAVSLRLAGRDGIDRMLLEDGLDVLVAPTNGPAWTIDPVNGDHFMGAASTMPAVAGYPHLTVPMGEVGGLPVGLSFVGPAWSDARMLAYGYAFEQRAGRAAAPTYAPSVDVLLARRGLLSPLAR